MNWIHKNIEITIDENAWFNFKCCGASYSASSLEEAKRIIDEKTKAFYLVDSDFFKNMYNKLNEREAMFLKQLIEELRCHQDNPYCELGIYNYLDFEIDDKVFKLCQSKKQ